MDLNFISELLPNPQSDVQSNDFSLGLGISSDALMSNQTSEMLLAKDWGNDEAKFCNRTSENIVGFKDTYGNGKLIEGTIVAPGRCVNVDAVVSDSNGDGRISQADWLWKGPNRIDVKVTPSTNAFGVAILPQDAWSAATIAGAVARNGAGKYGFMDFQTFRT